MNIFVRTVDNAHPTHTAVWCAKLILLNVRTDICVEIISSIRERSPCRGLYRQYLSRFNDTYKQTKHATAKINKNN